MLKGDGLEKGKGNKKGRGTRTIRARESGGKKIEKMVAGKSTLFYLTADDIFLQGGQETLGDLDLKA